MTFVNTPLIVLEVVRLFVNQSGIGGLYYLSFVMWPAFVGSIVAGLLAAFGVSRSRRSESTGREPQWSVQGLAAGVGGAVGLAPLLLYFSWLAQYGPGVLVVLFGALTAFVAYFAFAAIWCKRVERTSASGALLLFSVAFLNIPVLVFGWVEILVAETAPNSSTAWLPLLMVAPTFVGSIVAGLLAALGARIGSRVSRSAGTLKQHAGWRAPSVGAGVGAAVGSTLFLMYWSLLFHDGPRFQLLLFEALIVFTGFAVFTALRCRKDAVKKYGGN
ncbi:hypothetical protein AB0O87_01765 [Microbacterium sp. NPDC076768]|uniref:hypothetical protein n=1 Tax=Microbacterium sp. NPDC076768 TaxID=3154858 RepID=UPI00343E8D6E